MEIMIKKKANRKPIGRPKGQVAANAGEKTSTKIERDKALVMFEANISLVDRLIYEGLHDRRIAKSVAIHTGAIISEAMVRDRRYKLLGKS